MDLIAVRTRFGNPSLSALSAGFFGINLGVIFTPLTALGLIQHNWTINPKPMLYGSLFNYIERTMYLESVKVQHFHKRKQKHGDKDIK